MFIDKILKEKKIGKEYEIKGWVYRIRKLKEKVFVIVRDSNGYIQVVFEGPLKEEAEKLKIESSLIVRGKLVEAKKAPEGVELKATKLKIVHIAEDFPIGKDATPEFLADVRHLWLRSKKMTAILKIRSTVFGSIHEFFRNEGFYEFHSPIFQSTQCEGGSELFEVKYFDKVVYLTQTWQLPAETAIFALERIYTVAPTFRAEKSITARHLTEFWMAEAEMAWMEFDEMNDLAERLVKHVVKSVLNKNKKELEILGRKEEKLWPTIEKKFPRLRYSKALEILESEFGMKIPWGKDLRTIEEEKLTTLYDTPIIVTHYPKKVKAFYMKIAEDDPRTVLGSDFLAPEGIGEIIGASERETDINSIVERLKEQGEDPKNYEYYLDTRRYGSVPHSGFGMGIERVIRWICGLETIKESIPFPRTPRRFYP